MSKIIQLTLTIIAITASPFALGASYTVPDDGWYQLQNPTTLQEMCSSLQGTCEVPAGTYTLINHSLPGHNPRHRQSITIRGSATPPPSNALFTIETTVVTKDCVYGYPGRPFANDDLPCVAQCPSHYARTGGSCKASREDDAFIRDRNGNTVSTRRVRFRIATIDTAVADGYACEIDKNLSFTPIDADTVRNNYTTTEVQATAICSIIVSK